MNLRNFLILIFSIFFSSCSKSNEQNKSNVETNNQTTMNNAIEFPPALIQGILRDHNNQPLPRANIQVKKNNSPQEKPLGAATPFSGEYYIRIPMTKDSINVTVIFTYSSYKPDTNLVQVISGDTVEVNHRFELK